MKLKQEITMIVAALAAVGSYADVFGTGTNQFSIEFVNIGNAGNAAQSAENRAHSRSGGDGYGAVGYDYRIGKTEVTIDQLAKARAVDVLISDGDEGYWNDGIRTVGADGPAAFVSAHEGMKFANWLTTGNATNGAYQFNATGTMLLAVDRAAAVTAYGTVYVLPSEDEWHKAAYYRPDNGGTYSLFANGSDEQDDVTHGTTDGWNYYLGGTVNPSPNYMWATGFGGLEQNGTHDMMGNVFEWTESAVDGSTNNLAANRVYRGGEASIGYGAMLSSTRYSAKPSLDQSNGLGFRIAAIGTAPVPMIDVSINIGSAVEIEWSSISGQYYQVQYSTNLVSTNWFNLGGNIMATNAASHSMDPTPGVSHRFYRIISD